MNDSSSSRGEGDQNVSKETGNEADKELNRAESNVVKAKASENCFLNVYKRKNKETSSEQVQVGQQKVEEGNGGENDQKQNTTTEPNANETSGLGEHSESSKKDQLGLEQPGDDEKQKTAEVKAKDDGALGEQLGGSKKELKPRKTTDSKGKGRSDSYKQSDKQKATETKTKAKEDDKKKGIEVKNKAKGEDKEIFTEVKTRARTEEDKQRATGGKTKAKEEDKQKPTEVKTKAKGEDKQKATVVKTKTENKQNATEKKTKAEAEDKQKATTVKTKTVTEDKQKATEVKTKAKSLDKKSQRNEVNKDEPMDSKDDSKKTRKEKEVEDKKKEKEKLEVDDLKRKMSTLELKVRPEENEQRERVSKKMREGNVKDDKLNGKKVKSDNHGRKVQNPNEKKHTLVETGDDGRKGSIQDGKKKQKVVDNVNDSEDEKEIGTSETALYKFPMNRVAKIIRNEEFNGRISQEAIFLINKALEKFLELFAEEAYASALPDHKSYISYDHLSSVVAKRKRFDFLADYVPEKVNWEDVVREMSKDDDDDDDEETT